MPFRLFPLPPDSLQFQHEQQLPELESRLKALLSGESPPAMHAAQRLPPPPLHRGHAATALMKHSGNLTHAVCLLFWHAWAEASEITPATDVTAAEYSAGRARLEEQMALVRTAVHQPQHCLHFLRPGRIIRVAEGGWGCGVGRGRDRVRDNDQQQLLPHTSCAHCVQTQLLALPASQPLALHITAPPDIRTAAGGRQWGYGVVVSVFRKQAQDRQGVPESAAAAYVVDTLLCCSSSSSRGKLAAAAGGGPPEPAALGAADAEMQVSWVPQQRLAAVGPQSTPASFLGMPACCANQAAAGATHAPSPSSPPPQPRPPTRPPTLLPSPTHRCLQVVPVPLPLVTDICTLRISIPGDLRPPESRRAVLLTLRELLKKYPPQHVLPLLDPVADMGIQDERVEAALAGAAAIRQQLATNPIWRVSGVVGSSREVPGVEWVGTGTYMHACCGCTPVLLR